MKNQRAALAATVGLLVLGVMAPVNAYVPPGQTHRVSVATGGDEVGHGGLPAATCCSVISADGEHVAFTSGHDTLVAGDANMTLDVFVHHRATGVTERVSVGADGSELLGESYAPAISGNGRFVAFESNAVTVVPGDENFSNDVFVRDMVAKTIQRVSVTPGGGWSSGYAAAPDISADGRYVAFQEQRCGPGGRRLQRAAGRLRARHADGAHRASLRRHRWHASHRWSLGRRGHQR